MKKGKKTARGKPKTRAAQERRRTRSQQPRREEKTRDPISRDRRGAQMRRSQGKKHQSPRTELRGAGILATRSSPVTFPEGRGSTRGEERGGQRFGGKCMWVTEDTVAFMRPGSEGARKADQMGQVLAYNRDGGTGQFQQGEFCTARRPYYEGRTQASMASSGTACDLSGHDRGRLYLAT
ncbi:hypothetical protein NDU88_006227 [Pleurodeles waltl]|uniref:Uncharacterized protein n=1 Tax=Pleurodeles waltl TaxID=8319 RepID=A0AAV7X0Y4_PLEWA|nr:hypothetical protein NDU88_006227 [Pleurodeles waltl]